MLLCIFIINFILRLEQLHFWGYGNALWRWKWWCGCTLGTGLFMCMETGDGLWWFVMYEYFAAKISFLQLRTSFVYNHLEILFRIVAYVSWETLQTVNLCSAASTFVVTVALFHVNKGSCCLISLFQKLGGSFSYWSGCTCRQSQCQKVYTAEDIVCCVETGKLQYVYVSIVTVIGYPQMKYIRRIFISYLYAVGNAML